MKLNYYYFLATVTNATSPCVRTLTIADCPTDAFASAAIGLSNYKLRVTAMQELTEAQYHAPNQAPMASAVQVQPVAA